MRNQNWPMILEQEISEQKDAPFVWGENDCLHFAVSTASKLVDYDLKGNMKGDTEYDSEEAGYALLESNFEGKLQNIVDQHLGRRRNIRLGYRGDIAMVSYQGRDALGIVDGTGRRIVLKTLDGIDFVPLHRALIVWEVE